MVGRKPEPSKSCGIEVGSKKGKIGPDFATNGPAF